MYPELDEAILKALKESTEPILNKFKITLPGKKTLDFNSKSIMIANIGNKLETAGDDFDERKIEYSLLLSNLQLEYLKAMQLLRDVTKAVLITLRKDLDDDYSNFMKIEDINPEYDDSYVLKRAEIIISFFVDEDYGIVDNEFEEVNVNTEVI